MEGHHMRLNTFEFVAMNNPLRAAIQRRFEARRLMRMGGTMNGGRALEIGCGRGVGVEIILHQFGAETVDAFDLDPRMVELASSTLKDLKDRVNLWVGDATKIEASDSTYDAVFDFGIIHHIPEWRTAVAEVFRVLKPGGRFFSEEVLRGFILHPLWRALLEHPQEDRYDHEEFKAALAQCGFTVLSDNQIWNSFGWYVADKRT
jgi:ubiquinone/menaquinone biosynthesis C-methylase UbiE